MTAGLHPAWVPPLGIAFFTFHHIMYLTDLRAERAPAFGLVGYGLYSAFFPLVLAGPPVRRREVMHQCADRSYAQRDATARFASGLMRPRSIRSSSPQRPVRR